MGRLIVARREIEIIGLQLPKSKEYIAWCKKHKIDPKTGTAIKDESIT